MGLPVGGTAPSYSGNFIPEIWSGKLVEKFYDATIFTEIANTDYEGEIKAHGDTVHIRTRPSITIRNYVKGAGLIYEDPDSPKVQLDIDQAKYFAFNAYSVDKFQADINLMNEWGEDASEQMKIEIDTDILGAVYADAAAENSGNTAGRKSGDIALGEAAAPLNVNKTNILDVLVDYGTVLDEQNIPEANRWVVMPAKMCALVKKSELKDASISGDGTSLLRNGRLGTIDRFTLYSSNNVHAAGGEHDILFGHKSAITFAAQATEMEDVPNPNDFGRLIRGLNVYGFEVIKGESLGHSVVTIG